MTNVQGAPGISEQIPKDHVLPPKFILRRNSDDQSLARIRAVPPPNMELFAFCLILLPRLLLSFNDVKRWNRQTYISYRSAAVAMGI